jgi:formate hydrogenlyase subunit 4
MAMIAIAIFIVLLAENARIPVDDPNTHLELTMIHEVMVLDHSGPDFGFILYAAALSFGCWAHC